ncbi:hypothetical protein DPEC_G00087750 [Dallia pectoralis]|uniref:Uncharacterized protein n=1 Tax=Dallia pectoralis TaxID=75939 RepID=A0ACC2GZW9_DALPE|nr:hypothetical protein DPEC_G00087750 [Dallia pectoralis]
MTQFGISITKHSGICHSPVCDVSFRCEIGSPVGRSNGEETHTDFTDRSIFLNHAGLLRDFICEFSEAGVRLTGTLPACSMRQRHQRCCLRKGVLRTPSPLLSTLP